MGKDEFLKQLRSALCRVTGEERKRCLAYYGEVLSDKMESGMSETEAVNSLEPIEVIAERLTADAAERGQLRPKRSALSITLIIVGAPLWFPLLVTAYAVMVSLMAAAWAVIVTLVAVELAFFASSVAALVATVLPIEGKPDTLVLFAAALILMGLALLLLKPLCALIKLAAGQTAKPFVWLWRKIFKKDGNRQ